MQEAGLPPPRLHVQSDFVTMTFFTPGIAQETPGKTPGKTPELILQHLQKIPHISIPELASRLGKSVSAIERAIRKLRTEGQLDRIGPAKGGHWKVVG